MRIALAAMDAAVSTALGTLNFPPYYGNISLNNTALPVALTGVINEYQ